MSPVMYMLRYNDVNINREEDPEDSIQHGHITSLVCCRSSLWCKFAIRGVSWYQCKTWP